jgi:hypothetical protein
VVVVVVGGVLNGQKGRSKMYSRQKQQFKSIFSKAVRREVTRAFRDG